MLIAFRCEHCDSKLEIEAAQAGTGLDCPQCGSSITAPERRLGPGVTVGGCRIEKLIGQGGMGKVFLARQLSLDRPVALKILASSFGVDTSLSERFLREIHLLAQLQHRHIVSAFEAGEDDGVLYLVMAFVKGESLDARLEGRGPFGEAEALEIVRKLVDALEHAWTRHRLLHRDIKPSNVLLDEHGEPQLVDFGVAKRLNDTVVSHTLSNELLGTPNYMSPEHADGEPDLDLRTDMYSLGATLYHMLTGQVPFHANSVMETLRKQAQEKLPDPRTVAPRLSPGCVALLQIMLARKAQHRHPDWASLAADMEQVLAGGRPSRPVPPADETAVENHDGEMGSDPVLGPLMRAGRRHRTSVLVTAVVAGVVALALIEALIFLRFHRPSPPPPAAAQAPVFRPGATNPAGADTEPPVRFRELGAAYAAAMRYVRDHPRAYADGIARLEEVRRDARGTQFARMASEEIERILRVRTRAISNAVATVRARTDSLLASNGLDDAAAFLQDETGLFSAETAPLRAELLATIREKQALARQREEEQSRREQEARQAAEAAAKAVAANELTVLLDRVAEELVQGNTTAGLLKLREGTGGDVLAPVSNRLAQAREFVRQVAEMPTILLNPFGDQAGQDVTVEFRDGETETRRIVGTEPGRVLAKRQFSAGWVQQDFALNDVSTREKWQRLRGREGDAYTAMRGLLACEAGYWDKALASFETVQNPIGRALCHAATRRTAAGFEQEARHALSGLLETAGLAGATNDLDAAVQQVRERAWTADAADGIRSRLDTLAATFGKTRTVRDSLPLLLELSSVNTNAMRPIVPLRTSTEQALQTTLADLREANPSLGGALPKTRVRGSGIDLNLAGLNLRDLRPLAGLPIEHLNLAGTSTRGLYALCGMPLESLDIADTLVRDLRPVAGCPLRRLDAAETHVEDLEPLAGTETLEALDASATLVRELPAPSWPALTELRLADTRVSDLSPLTGLSLTDVDLSESAVTDLSPLSGMPIRTLRLNDTAVQSLAPLTNMPIAHLEIRGCSALQDLERLPEYAPGLIHLGIDAAAADAELFDRWPKLKTIDVDGAGPVPPADWSPATD